MFSIRSASRPSKIFRKGRSRTSPRCSLKRRSSIESLERRDLLAVTPTAPFAFGGPGVDAGYAIAVDAANNYYLTGIFSDTVDFDPGPGVTNLTSNGDFDIFVAKYHSDGSLAWARGFGSESQDTASDWRQSIAVDGVGNVYVLTSFADTVAFDDIVLSSVGTTTGWKSNVVICLNDAGMVEWATPFGDSSYAGGFAIHTVNGAAAAGSIYIAGQFSGTQPFGAQEWTAAGDRSDGFLSCLDAGTGQFLWTNRTTGTSSEGFTNIAIDGSQESIYVTGYKRGGGGTEAIIGSFNLGKGNGQHAIAAKADLLGNFQWAKIIADGSSTAWGIATYNGKVAIAGEFSSQYASFGNIRLTNANGKRGGNDLFVTQLDSTGSFDWALGVGSTANDGPRPKLAADQFGNVWMDSGLNGLGGQAQIGSETVPAGHFVTQIDAASGTFVKTWSFKTGIKLRNMNTDPAGNLWVTGLFEGTVTFPDGTTLASNNTSQDFFLQQFSRAPAAPATSQTAASTDEPLGRDDSTVLLNAACVDQLFTQPESTWTHKVGVKMRV
ncbi:MAG: hypothetical protein WD894_18205 [Pirellulales bacterium]